MSSQKPINKKKQAPPKQKTKSLSELIADNENFEFIDNGKIKCILTNHEMAATEENYLKYLQSKSYKKGQESVFDISLYEDILVNHKGNDGYFFCQLTGVKVPKKKSAIEKHVNGKKFQRRFKEAQENESEEDIDFEKIAELEGDDEGVDGEEEEKKTKSSKKNRKEEHLTSRKEAVKTKKISKDNKHGKNQKKQQKGEHKQTKTVTKTKTQVPNSTETAIPKSSNNLKKSSGVSSKQMKINKAAKKNK